MAELEEHIVRNIKEQRVRLLRYVWRSGLGRTVHAVLQWEHGGRRKRNKSRSTLIAGVSGLNRAGKGEWQNEAARRKLLRKYVKQYRHGD